MIIKTSPSIAQQQKKLTLFKKGLPFLLGSAIIAIIIYSGIWIFQYLANPAKIDLTLIADAEEVDGNYFVLNGYKVDGAINQSKDYAHSGKHSLKLLSTSPYGFNFNFKDIKLGDVITAQVWVYSPEKEAAKIVLAANNIEDLYVESSELECSDDWKLLEVSTKITKPIPGGILKFYCYNLKDKPVYFDDFAFSKNSNPNLENANLWTPERINLHIPEMDYKKLQDKRLEALEQGILFNSDDAWVDAYILPAPEKANKESKLKVSLRLKGDWTDHLEGEHWSFRIQTPTDQAWNRLKVFSLQHPKTRAYLLEWMLHQFFLYEDVLTTRYEFIDIALNGKDMGLYVYEEHFTKQIPEFNRKKEGPIVRFVENGFWENELQKTKLGAYNPNWGTSNHPDIKPFEEKKIASDSVLSAQYRIAQNLLHEYKYQLKPAKDIFDLDLLAKYYVIIDITGGYHGSIWHNQRFYYNPVSGKLEPIGFDGFSTDALASLPEAPFIASNASFLATQKKWHEWLFMDKDFLEKYLYYLEKFSSEEYLQKFLTHIDLKLNQRLLYIQKSYKDYSFSTDYMIKRAKTIRLSLFPTSESLLTKTVKPGLIAICNRHPVPVHLIGTATYDQGNVYPLDSPQMAFTTPLWALPNYSQQIVVPNTAKFLVYQLPGLEKLYYAAINQWSVPEAFSPVQILKPNLVDNHLAYWHIPKEKQVVFRKDAKITEPIIIPEGYSVLFESGTKIDITKNAFILSYSDVQFLGTEEEPIIINSSDNSARSFTVIKAKNKSSVKHTTFSNFTNFSYNGWILPGAVNFYESDVDISHSTFTKNSCEDALNIVRANFNFKHNIISNTFGDGFDSDFCTGIVANSYFYNMGNDAIDFSTSIVTIQDCKIEKTGDKGISMGEQGTATINNTNISGSVIGIASKDLSQVTINNVRLSNCKMGFAAYEKKPEYGQAFLYVNSYTAENVELLYKINPGSYLKLINKEINGL